MTSILISEILEIEDDEDYWYNDCDIWCPNFRDGDTW